jgi:hypothetical protein
MNTSLTKTLKTAVARGQTGLWLAKNLRHVLSGPEDDLLLCIVLGAMKEEVVLDKLSLPDGKKFLGRLLWFVHDLQVPIELSKKFKAFSNTKHIVRFLDMLEPMSKDNRYSKLLSWPVAKAAKLKELQQRR